MAPAGMIIRKTPINLPKLTKRHQGIYKFSAQVQNSGQTSYENFSRPCLCRQLADDGQHDSRKHGHGTGISSVVLGKATSRHTAGNPRNAAGWASFFRYTGKDYSA